MPEPRASALMGVRGMDTPESRERVLAALRGVPGVDRASPADAERVNVVYDPSEVTVMDLIRALRRIGFLSGME